LREIQKFMRDNTIFGYIETDHRARCYYVHMKTKKTDKWFIEILWFEEYKNKSKFEMWKKIVKERVSL